MTTKRKRRALIRAWTNTCVYCGVPTRQRLTCAKHRDLPLLDPLLRERLTRKR